MSHKWFKPVENNPGALLTVLESGQYQMTRLMSSLYMFRERKNKVQVRVT